MCSVSNGAGTASVNFIRQASHVEKNTILEHTELGRIPLGLAHAVFLSLGILQVEHAALISLCPAINGVCVSVLRYFPQCSLIEVN